MQITTVYGLHIGPPVDSCTHARSRAVRLACYNPHTLQWTFLEDLALHFSASLEKSSDMPRRCYRLSECNAIMYLKGTAAGYDIFLCALCGRVHAKDRQMNT